MNKQLGNDLYMDILTQVINEMKAEQGEDFSLTKINLAELERRTGISRARLRKLKDVSRSCLDMYAGPQAVDKLYISSNRLRPVGGFVFLRVS